MTLIIIASNIRHQINIPKDVTPNTSPEREDFHEKSKKIHNGWIT
jgi:hypothetical protein